MQLKYTCMSQDDNAPMFGKFEMMLPELLGVNKRLSAKINRMEGVVVFKKSQRFTNDVLNGWNYDVRHLLDKVEQTCHLINREKVVHNA